MSLFTILFRLRSIGVVLSKVGELLMRIGSSPSLTEIVKEETASGPGQQPITQDSSNSQGVENEKPDVDEGRDESPQGDLFETTKEG